MQNNNLFFFFSLSLFSSAVGDDVRVDGRIVARQASDRARDRIKVKLLSVVVSSSWMIDAAHMQAIRGVACERDGRRVVEFGERSPPRRCPLDRVEAGGQRLILARLPLVTCHLVLVLDMLL